MPSPPTALFDSLRNESVRTVPNDSKISQIKLTKGKVKIAQDVKTVQLLKNDRFSCADINLSVPDGYTGIKYIELDAKSAERFERVDNGNGSIELHFKDNVVTTGKATVKLNVYLEGNNTAKPDAVLKVAVKVV